MLIRIIFAKYCLKQPKITVGTNLSQFVDIHTSIFFDRFVLLTSVIILSHRFA